MSAKFQLAPSHIPLDQSLIEFANAQPHAAAFILLMLLALSSKLFSNVL